MRESYTSGSVGGPESRDSGLSRQPAHRAHRRATLLPATAPRSDAEPARHFPARRREQRRRADSPASITAAVPRGRVTRGFTGVAD